MAESCLVVSDDLGDVQGTEGPFIPWGMDSPAVWSITFLFLVSLLLLSYFWDDRKLLFSFSPSHGRNLTNKTLKTACVCARECETRHPGKKKRKVCCVCVCVCARGARERERERERERDRERERAEREISLEIISESPLRRATSLSLSGLSRSIYRRPYISKLMKNVHNCELFPLLTWADSHGSNADAQQTLLVYECELSIKALADTVLKKWRK